MPRFHQAVAVASSSLRNVMWSSTWRFVLLCIYTCVAFFGCGCQRVQPTQALRATSEKNTTNKNHENRHERDHLPPAPQGTASDLDAYDYDSAVKALLAGQSIDAWSKLQQAMAKAQQDEKCVLLQMGGPGCAPCVKLSRYLAGQVDEISRDYVYVKLDTRMPDAEKVQQQFGPRPWSIPWMVILSPTGDVLAKSEVNGGNIGYPSSESSKNHFRKMLASTARRLSSEEIESIVSRLENY